MTEGPGITFASCVESGWLETQTVRSVESLRQFGGRFSNAPLIAVTPRFGPPLSKGTRDIFQMYGVKHIRLSSSHPYAWFNFYNRLLALVAAESHATTDSIGFLACDLLIVKEPEQLELVADETSRLFRLSPRKWALLDAGS